MVIGQARQKAMAQIRESAEKLGSGVIACLAVACLAVIIAAASLVVATRTLRLLRT